MKNTSRLLDNLRDKGERITDVRKAIIEILSAAPRPLSVQDLLSALKKKQLAVREIRIQDRSARYEVSLGDDHHHHLVCTKCHKTEDISFEEDLERQEKVIMHKKKFKVLQHSLEFFGLCASCQKK